MTPTMKKKNMEKEGDQGQCLQKVRDIEDGYHQEVRMKKNPDREGGLGQNLWKSSTALMRNQTKQEMKN